MAEKRESEKERTPTRETESTPIRENYVTQINPEQGFSQNYLIPIKKSAYNMNRRNFNRDYEDYITNANLAMFANPSSKLYNPLRAIGILQEMFPNKLTLEELQIMSSGNDGPGAKELFIKTDFSQYKQPQYIPVNGNAYCVESNKGITLG